MTPGYWWRKSCSKFTSIIKLEEVQLTSRGQRLHLFIHLCSALPKRLSKVAQRSCKNHRRIWRGGNRNWSCYAKPSLLAKLRESQQIATISTHPIKIKIIFALFFAARLAAWEASEVQLKRAREKCSYMLTDLITWAIASDYNLILKK